jgi:hypothetical protein
MIQHAAQTWGWAGHTPILHEDKVEMIKKLDKFTPPGSACHVSVCTVDGPAGSPFGVGGGCQKT